MSNNEQDNQSDNGKSQHLDAQSFEPAVITPVDFKPSDGLEKSKSFSISPLKIMLGLLLLVGATVVWYLFTAKSVTVKTTPATQNFQLSGGLLFELKGHYIMREGQYHLAATLPGYYPIDQAIDVDQRQNQTINVEFKKLPGTLTVNTPDEVLADIYIDGQLVGQSNQKLTDITAGDHEIKVDAERYFSHQQTFTIEGMAKHQDLDVELKPAWANVIVRSEPVGATLSSNNQAIGTTPFNGTLLQGKHALTLTLDGYKSWEQNINVIAENDVKLSKVYLEQADGILQLTSKPNGVSVTMNGKYQGLTPITLNVAAVKSHQLSFYKDGYLSTQKGVKLTAGEEQAMSVELKPKYGQVAIHADTKDALLYVDGNLMGRANQTITLTVKQHDVVVKKDGFVDYKTTVLPRADLQQIVDVRMKTLEQARWESYKPMLTTSLGSQLKLFKPKDVFTMGASRREQGRRSNEVNRRVSLKRPFYIGLTEVSNAQFRKFIRHHSSGHVKGNSLNGEKQPVVSITWQQAALFCNWLSEKEKLPLFYQIEDDAIVGVNPDATGYRLPTEAEWTWATRYQAGQMLKYSWGTKLPPGPNSGNFADRSGATILGFIQATYNDKYAVSAPIGTFPPNEKGLYDLSGNVAEWMNDHYEVKTGLASKIEKDPLGSDKGDYYVIRGSSWAHGTMTELRLSYRDYGIDARNDVGFRIARFVDTQEVVSE